MNRKLVFPLLVVVAVVFLFALTAGAGNSVKVNINTASPDELVQLKGVGAKYAAKIVEYREKNGPFKLPEELSQASGIGQKTFEANQEVIIVEEPKPKKK